MADPYEHSPKIVLNQYKRYEDGRVLPIQVFGSNSEQGTAIHVKPVNSLFDIGVCYDRIKELQDSTDYIIVSHDHSDHLDWKTVKKFLSGHPSTNILLPDFVEVPKEFQYLSKQIRVAHDHMTMSLKLRNGEEIQVIPIKTPHGPEYTFAYALRFQGANLLFSTDLSSTESLPKDIDFDIIMIETNYDEDEFTTKNGAGGAKNHLSVQESLRYATTHLTEFGRIIPLHFGPSMRNFNQLNE